MCLPEVKSAKEPLQFPLLYLKDSNFTVLGPGEAVNLLNSLPPGAKSISVPVQSLEDIPSLVTEEKQIPAQWIQLELFLNENGKPVRLFPHVSKSGTEENSNTREIDEHHTDSSTLTSLLSTSSSKSAPTVSLI